MFDTHKNFAIGTVLTAPADASGEDFILMLGDGEFFEPNMPVTLCPPNVQATADNSEIGYLTAVDGDALTMTRAQEGSTPMQAAAGWRVYGSLTAKSLTDIEDETKGKASRTGDTFSGDLELASTYPSDDVPGGVDGTRRLNLQSRQRAHTNSFGETIRHFLVRKDAKAMEAYYVPKLGYDENRDAIADFNADGSVADISQWRAVSWTGSHFEANDHNSNHVHWELEIPDSTGALQGRLEVPFANPATGVIGLDKTFIRTNLADFVVRTSNGQMLRLSSPAGNFKPIEFNHDSEGSTSFRRWQVRATNAAESGANAGTDFKWFDMRMMERLLIKRFI